VVEFTKTAVMGSRMVILLTCGLVPASVTAQPLGRANEAVIEAECRLKYMRGTTSAAARSYLGKSCNFMGLPSAGFDIARQERVFHSCILEVLPGTEDDRNAVELANACRARAWAN